MTAQSKTLIIMRHGKSDWDSGVSRDFARPLSRRGSKDVPRMAKWLQTQQFLPQRLISSPARRAADTAMLIAENCGLEREAIVYDDAIYEAGREDLCAVIARHAGDSSRLLLVGHNPALDDLLEYLVNGRLPLTAGGKLMTTAAVAVLDCNDWQLPQGSCQLRHLQRPKDLKD